MADPIALRRRPFSESLRILLGLPLDAPDDEVLTEVSLAAHALRHVLRQANAAAEQHPAHMLSLPYPSPPLSLNHRHPRRQRDALTAQLRRDAWALAKQAKIGGPHERVEVVLHWRPGRRGTYDEDNPTPTLKACADGITDAGVVVDDSREHMAKRVEIHDPVRGQRAALWLTVQVLA